MSRWISLSLALSFCSCAVAQEKLQGIGRAATPAEIAAKYRGDGGAEARLYAKVRDGGQGAWGPVPMPPHPHLQEGDVRTMVRWILTSQ